MSYIGIGSPIPEIVSLPGQTGGEVTVTLDYPSSAVCTSAEPFSPSEATPPGGTFAATPSGLTINASTGEVTPSTSTPQAYTISYTVSGVTSQFALTVNAVQQSTFSYSSSSFQQIGTATPTLAAGTTAGGTFTADTGVSINASTGVIDLAASTIGGPYTITYTTPGPCATSSTFDISITAVAIELIDNNFAVEFNGVDEYVQVASSDYAIADWTNPWTISFWVKYSTSLSWDLMATFGVETGSASTTRYIMIGGNQGYLFTGVGDTDGGSTTIKFNIGSGLNDDNWHHVVYVGNGTSGDFPIVYIDGVVASPSGGTTGLNNSSTYLNVIGTGSDATGRYFPGDIDEVAIWSRALQLDDIQRIYNATNDNPGKTANLWSAGLNTGLVYWNRMGD